MELLPFLILSLSVFGAALAALSALRSHYESELFQTRRRNDVHLKELKSSGADMTDAKKFEKKANFWSSSWSISQWVPIALFAGFLCYVVVGIWRSSPPGIGDQGSVVFLNWGAVQWFTSAFLTINMVLFFWALLSAKRLLDRAESIAALWRVHPKCNGSDLEPDDE